MQFQSDNEGKLDEKGTVLPVGPQDIGDTKLLPIHQPKFHRTWGGERAHRISRKVVENLKTNRLACAAYYRNGCGEDLSDLGGA